jgi:hypothetical protein
MSSFTLWRAGFKRRRPECCESRGVTPGTTL